VSTEAQHLIEEFGALPEPSKREVLAELLRISRHLDYPEMNENELTSAANEVFLGYDDREVGG
jgi:DNA-binding transcriptional ArsR family regulator